MLVVAPLDGDVNDPFVAVTTPGGNLGETIRPIAGIGNPYLVFANGGIPFDYTNGIVANFTGAPVCSDDVATNSTNITAMLEDPPLNKISAP